MIDPDMLPCESPRWKDAPRLLLLVPWLAMGGADKFNLDLLAQLTRRGWEVIVATTVAGDHSWLPSFVRYTSDIFILPHFLRIADYPRFIRYLIQSHRIDVVLIANSEWGYRLLPYLRAHFPAVTFLDFCHMEEGAWRKGGYPRLAVEYQEMLDLHIVASAYLKGWMVRHGAEAARVRVCYINVDADHWHPDPARRVLVRQELGVNERIPVILYAGRMGAQKQPRVFAQTMVRLAQQAAHFVSVVAGDGPELPWLRTFVHRHGLGQQVRLLGAVTNERVRELMVASDVFFLPSQWEGIALSIYEAMACGLPIVAADVGGQRELVTPQCGVLLTRSNEDTEAEHYTAILAPLLENPRRREEMGRAGRQRVKTHFCLDQMGERMMALLQEAMRLHTLQPRPVPDLVHGQARAVRTVRVMQTQAVLRRLLSSSLRAVLDNNLRWLRPLKEKIEWAVLR